LLQKRQSRGQALIELAILAPWIFFLFISVVDTGFCIVAAISVQNAARAAALYTSSRSAPAGGSCAAVTQNLQSLPNYAAVASAGCSSLPLQVTFQQLASGIDGNPAAQVTVTYQTIQLIPVPVLFSGPVTFVRTVQMPMRP
jgi:Flp pilus assembly protein TadG